MVKKPTFILKANGVDVTEQIQENLISLSFTDEANEKADELTLRVAGKIARPQYEDVLHLYLGYDDELSFVGSFSVQTTTRQNSDVLSISATGVNFSNSLKEKRDITYEKISLKNICNQIANRSKLKLKSDFDEVFIISQAQSNESDLHFLNRLAKEYNAIFNIKNDTLIFTQKIKEEKKNDDLPAYVISAAECNPISIKHSNKTLYKSCKAIWHDTKENKTQEIVVQSGEPCLINKGNYKNAAEAKNKAAAKLQRANQGIVSGDLTKEGEIIFAGGKLLLTDSIEDDGEYQIKSVKHTFDSNGWMISINFER